MQYTVGGKVVFDEKEKPIHCNSEFHFWRAVLRPWAYSEGKCQVVSDLRPISNCTSFLINACRTCKTTAGSAINTRPFFDACRAAPNIVRGLHYADVLFRDDMFEQGKALSRT